MDLKSLDLECPKCSGVPICKGLVHQASSSQVDTATDSPQHAKPKRLRVYQAWEGNEVRGARGAHGSRGGANRRYKAKAGQPTGGGKSCC